jgi:hypothetical protein
MYISKIKPQYCDNVVREMHIQHTGYGQVWWVQFAVRILGVSGKTANQGMKTNR